MLLRNIFFVNFTLGDFFSFHEILVHREKKTFISLDNLDVHVWKLKENITEDHLGGIQTQNLSTMRQTSTLKLINIGYVSLQVLLIW